MQNKNKEQEARSFIGRKGPVYVSSFASKKEKAYFNDTIYNDGGLLLQNALYSYYPSSASNL